MTCYLLTALLYLHTENLVSHAFLLLEELSQYLVALQGCLLAKVLAQHVAHQLHLGVHHASVGPDDVCSEHEHRHKEAVALALLLLLAADAHGYRLTANATGGNIEQRANNKTYKSAQRAKGAPP